MRHDATETGRRRFLRLAGGVAGAGVGLPALTGRATAQTATWERRYDYQGHPSEFFDIAVTRDGGYVTAGSVYPGIQEANVLATKLDDGGDVEWSRTYDADPDDEYDNDYGNAVAELADGYAIAGTMDDPDSVRVLKLDSEGALVRSRQFDRTETSRDSGIDVVAVPGTDGPASLVVLASSVVDGNVSTWLLGLDDEFDVRWERTYGEGTYLDPVELVRTADGGYAVVATVRRSDDDFLHLWLGRTDDCGRLCWSRMYDARGGAAGLAERRVDGRTSGYALAGTGYYQQEQGWSFPGLVVGPDGALVASRRFEPGGYVVGEDVVSTEGGYAFLATASPQPGDVSFYLVSTDADLDVRWREYYGRTQSYDHIEYAEAVTYADGEYGLAGAYFSGGDFDTADGYVFNVVEDA